VSGDSEWDFKLVVLGPKSVGKTCVICRYCSGSFDESTVATLGAAFAAYSERYESTAVNLMPWDTAGQECFLSEPVILGLKGLHGRSIPINLTLYESDNDFTPAPSSDPIDHHRNPRVPQLPPDHRAIQAEKLWVTELPRYLKSSTIHNNEDVYFLNPPKAGLVVERAKSESKGPEDLQGSLKSNGSRHKPPLETLRRVADQSDIPRSIFRSGQGYCELVS
jgi:hypothetical protein